ncbi:MAG: GNAT family N-acetyltransferase [Defluviitaleaceae bacterium]|nr:GNAT family N-acetyltransferase [Defluviitaleaceae bacterium]
MKNLILIRPSEAYHDEIQDYRQELLAYDDHSHGESFLYETADISQWIENCRLYENKKTVPHPEHVEADQFMLVYEGDKRILGMINFRHSLDNPYLFEQGGHIGYGIRPLERRKGYATIMLALCLKKCRGYGLDKVLVCCAPDNLGSKKTILACGGVFERMAYTDDGDEADERYWIDLS